MKYTKAIIIILILILLPSLSYASFWSDGLTGDDICVKDFKTSITDYTTGNSERYVYSSVYDLKNVSTSFAGGKIITYYYNGDELITNNDTFNNNTTIIEDDYLLNEFHHVSVYSKLWTDEYVKVTHCNIVVLNDDGETIYNVTKPFDMDNYVKNSDLDLEIDDSNDEKPKSSVKSDDYKFFEETDFNDDGKIDFDEFSEVSFIFTEDSFWDGYSIEEILQSEWDRANSDGDDYLTFEEFKKVI